MYLEELCNWVAGFVQSRSVQLCLVVQQVLFVLCTTNLLVHILQDSLGGGGGVRMRRKGRRKGREKEGGGGGGGGGEGEEEEGVGKKEEEGEGKEGLVI